MNAYLISYDLRVPGRNYDDLYAAIKKYRHWAKVNESVWAVVTASSAKDIRDALAACIDANDRLFVLKSGTEAAWRNSICKNDWLKEHL